MMEDMVSQRGAILYATDDRFCIDNGLMIAQAGVLEYKTSGGTKMEETTCTQRFRTDEVEVTWRDD
jgi:N6-L-threonylcarbamoyladenine synthase